MSDLHAYQIQAVKRLGIAPISKITDSIYLGSVGSTDPEVLKHYKITHVINAAKEIDYHNKQIIIVRLNMDDVPEENLFRVLEPSRIVIKRILESDPRNRVLVHCMAGVSRSASVVIYFLMKEKGLTFQQALDMVERKRPVVNPNIGFTKTLKEVEKIK